MDGYAIVYLYDGNGKIKVDKTNEVFVTQRIVGKIRVTGEPWPHLRGLAKS